MATGRNLIKAGLVMCGITLVIQLLGFTCPGWVVTVTYLHVLGAVLTPGVSGYGVLTTMVAVWYGRVCVDADYEASDACSLATDHDARFYGYRVTTALWPLVEIDWTRVRVMLTLALFLCCLGVFLAAASLCDKLRVPTRLLTLSAAASMLFSGALVIPATLEVGLAIIDAEKATSKQNTALGYEFVNIVVPWALLLSCIGVITAFLGVLLLGIASLKEKQNKSMTITPESTEVLFNINNLGKHPSDISFSASSQGPAQLPRIGAPDTEALVFENAPFRAVQFSSFRAPNTVEESKPNQENNNNEQSKEMQDVCEKQTERNFLTVNKVRRQNVSSKQTDSNSKKNDNAIQQNEPAKPVNTYNSLATEGVPTSRHYQNQRRKSTGRSTPTQATPTKHNQETPPVIAGSPHTKPDNTHGRSPGTEH